MIELKNAKIVAKSNIIANSPIIELIGELSSLPFEEADLQIGNSLYLKPTGGIIDAIKHSCNPNAYLYIIGKRVFLYSLFNLKEGMEITYDYSLSSTDDENTWSMSCNCGVYCRKKVSGFQTLSKEIKDKYIKLGIVPIYLTDYRFKE